MAIQLLLIDNSITIQKVVELTFSDSRYAVLAANNLQEAAIRLQQQNPDIIIADTTNEQIDSLTFCDHLKNDPDHSSIPIILLVSKFTDDAEQRKFLECSDGTLSKPFDAAELRDLVTQMLAERRGEGSNGDAANQSLGAEDLRSSPELDEITSLRDEPPVDDLTQSEPPDLTPDLALGEPLAGEIVSMGPRIVPSKSQSSEERLSAAPSPDIPGANDPALGGLPIGLPPDIDDEEEEPPSLTSRQSPIQGMPAQGMKGAAPGPMTRPTPTREAVEAHTAAPDPSAATQKATPARSQTAPPSRPAPAQPRPPAAVSPPPAKPSPQQPSKFSGEPEMRPSVAPAPASVQGPRRPQRAAATAAMKLNAESGRASKSASAAPTRAAASSSAASGHSMEDALRAGLQAMTPHLAEVLHQKVNELALPLVADIADRLVADVAARLVSEIAQQVIPELAQRLVPEIAERLVTEIAERYVREELDEIKNSASRIQET